MDEAKFWQETHRRTQAELQRVNDQLALLTESSRAQIAYLQGELKVARDRLELSGGSAAALRDAVCTAIADGLCLDLQAVVRTLTRALADNSAGARVRDGLTGARAIVKRLRATDGFTTVGSLYDHDFNDAIDAIDKATTL